MIGTVIERDRPDLCGIQQEDQDLLDHGQAALATLLSDLRRQDYRFVPPTPATHARVVGRPDKRQARSLRDVFGWSLPFAPDLLPHAMLDALHAADAFEVKGDLLRSRVRVASLDTHLFLHSAYPTSSEHSVFFGPDSYRFVEFVRAELSGVQARRLVDIGTGSGVGGLMAAASLPNTQITLLDANPAALRLAAVNAHYAGLEAELVHGRGIDEMVGAVDLVLANPPYMADEEGRTYRDGGDMHGARVSLDWTLASAQRLSPGGRILLYTGVAIVDGRDALREALDRALPKLGCTLRYREIDPDVFGEDLVKPAYGQVERIAVIGAVVTRTQLEARLPSP